MNINKKSDARKFLEKLTGGPLTISKILQSTRLGEELSQAEFARILGIPRANLCDIEKGRRFVGPELAEKFAAILGKSKEQFVRIALQDQLNRSGLRYHIGIIEAA
jgi:transcriptional regulator with XRE-family HTH domain